MGAFGDRLVVPAVQSLSSVTAAQPLRCTSRSKRANEKDGREYEFVSREEMERRLADRELVEVGEFKDNLYGTTIRSVRQPMEEGKLVVLHCHPSTVRRLRLLGDVHPLVIFIKPESIDAVREAAKDAHPAEVQQQFEAAATMEAQHGSLFTHVVPLSTDLDKTRATVADIIRRECKADFWASLPFIVPRSEDLAEKLSSLGSRNMLTSGTSFRNIVVTKNRDGNYGFKVAAGTSASAPLRIKLLSPGPAYLTDEQLRDGDLICCINNVNLMLESHGKANDVVKRSADELSIVVFPAMSRPRLHKLKRKAIGFGLTLQSVDEDMPGVVVANSKHDSITVGETILAVDGKPMLLAAHGEVMSYFAAHKSVVIAVGPTPLPEVTHITLRPPTGNGSVGIKLATTKSGAYPYIIELAPGSPAALSQQIRLGDMLVQVNDLSTAVLNMETIKSMLTSPEGVTLSLLPASSEAREALASQVEASAAPRLVIIARGPDGLGLRVAAADSPDAGSLPLVQEVLPGSAAASTGAIFDGDVILKINGTSTQGRSQMEVLQLLSTKGDVELVVRGGAARATATEAADIAAPTSDAVEDAGEAQDAPVQAAGARTLVALRDRRRVTLKNEGRGLGLRVGTAEASEYPCILQVIDDSVAARTGSLYPDDLILAINNESMSRKSHDEVVVALKNSDVVVLDLARGEGPSGAGRTSFSAQALEQERHVVLARGATGYGIQIQTLNEPDAASFPVVGRIVEGSVAEREPNLHVGDSILAVDGISMAGAQQEAVTAALSATTKATLVVRQLRPEEVVDTWRVQLARNGGRLGLEIRVDSKPGTLPVIVSVAPGSAAALEGTIQPGDQIRYVNGNDASEVSHPHLIQLLTETDPVTIGMRRPAAVEVSGGPRTAAIGAQGAAPPIRKVQIARGGQGLGLHVMTDDRPSRDSYPAISDVVPGGAAGATGLVYQGDTILTVNGQSTQGMYHDLVLALLKEAGPQVELELQQLPETASLARRVSLLRRESKEQGIGGSAQGFVVPLVEKKGSTDPREVTLPKNPGQPLGLQIITSDSHPFPIVQQVLPTGSAAATNSVEPGDVIYAIDGQSTESVQHEQVIHMIASAEGQVTFTLGRLEPVRFGGDATTPREAALPSIGEVPQDERDVTLVRGSNGLGMHLTAVPAGIFVTGIVADGAAERGGLSRGDAIVRIEDLDTPGIDLATAVKKLQGRQEVTLRIARMPLDAARALALAEATAEQQASARDLRLVELRRGDRGLGMSIMTQDGPGCPLIGELVPGGPAAASGIVIPGDILLAINKQPTAEIPPEALPAQLSSSSEVSLLLGRQILPEGYRLVQLESGELGLGLRLTIEDDPRPEAMPQIAEILPTGAAARAKDLYDGDLLVQVNGRSMAGLREDEVVEALGSSTFVQLVVRQPLLHADSEAALERRTVHLKRAGRRLGLRVATADDMSYSQVQEVLPDGVAAEDGTIQRGDVILEVNGRAMTNVPHDTLLEALRESDELELVLCSGVPLPGDNTAEASPQFVADVVADETVAVLLSKAVSEAAASVVLQSRRASEIVGGPAPPVPASFAQDEDADDGDRPLAGRPSQVVMPVDRADNSNGSVAEPSLRPGRPSQVAVAEPASKASVAGAASASRPGRPSQVAVAVTAGGANVRADQKTRTVVLFKSVGNGRLGMKLVTPEKGPSVVEQILPGGAAEVSGEVREGDTIEAVAGQDMTSASHEALLAALGACEDRVELVLRGHKLVEEGGGDVQPFVAPAFDVMEEEDEAGDPTADHAVASSVKLTAREVAASHQAEPRASKRCTAVLERDGGSLGLRIVTFGNGLGVLITEVIPNTPAARCSTLKANDIIFAVSSLIGAAVLVRRGGEKRCKTGGDG
jgi:C-terminal processing protease CtpA/Prc/guanylate kinase